MPKASKSNTATAVQTAPAPARNSALQSTAPAPEVKSQPAAAKPARKDQAKPVTTVSQPLPAKEEQEITLKYVSPTAREVKVAGNFNGWHPNTTPLKNNGHGEWTVCLTLRSGQYEYRFVVDGHWVEDPQAHHRGANPFGGFNSILTVPAAARPTAL